jgi:hypothetical protein
VNVAEAVPQAEEAILRCRGVACKHAEKSPKHVWVKVSLEVLEVVRFVHIVIRPRGVKQACVSRESTRPNGAELSPGLTTVCEPVSVRDIRLVAQRHGSNVTCRDPTRQASHDFVTVCGMCGRW